MHNNSTEMTNLDFQATVVIPLSGFSPRPKTWVRVDDHVY